MGFSRRISTIVVSSVILGSSMLFLANNVHAEMNDAQKDAIVQNCGHIKQSLTKLQYADSRTRTYLGSSYEAVAGRFITPLNLRLVKNNQASSELFQIQNNFVAAQTNFRNYYVEYMRELEGVIATDCAAHPEEFYAKLTRTRERRESLRNVTKQLSELTDQQYITVQKLAEELK